MRLFASKEPDSADWQSLMEDIMATGHGVSVLACLAGRLPGSTLHTMLVNSLSRSNLTDPIWFGPPQNEIVFSTPIPLRSAATGNIFERCWRRDKHPLFVCEFIYTHVDRFGRMAASTEYPWPFLMTPPPGRIDATGGLADMSASSMMRRD